MSASAQFNASPFATGGIARSGTGLAVPRRSRCLGAARRWVVAIMLVALAVAPALAQEWPARPVKIIVPFAAGGPADIYARYIGQRLQEALGQAFVIDDRPGAGSVIGTDAAAKSPPDGYTLLLMSNTHTVNESLIPTLKELRAIQNNLVNTTSKVDNLSGAVA